MLKIEKNLMVVKAECMEAISVLEKEIQALKEEIAILDNKAEANEATALTEEEVPCVCESVLDDEDIADFWFRWKKNGDPNFAGFVDYNMPNKLSVGTRYGLIVGPVALIGEHLQLLAMLFNEEDWFNKTLDAPVGLIVEEYVLGSEAFKEMAIGVIAPWHDSIISVDVGRINDAVGTICLK